MTRKSKHARKRKVMLPQGTITRSGDIAPVKPKPGPGQVFRTELIDMKQGYAKRFRNIAVSPLTHAFFKGHLILPFDPAQPIEKILPDERYAAGLEIEKLWATLHVSAVRDSTTPGISSHAELFLTESKEQAGRRLRQLMARMERKDWAIVIKFAGEQWPAPHALQFAGVPFDRRSLWPRVCESLDGLVYATTGRIPLANVPFDPTGTAFSRPRAQQLDGVA